MCNLINKSEVSSQDSSVVIEEIHTSSNFVDSMIKGEWLSSQSDSDDGHII